MSRSARGAAAAVAAVLALGGLAGCGEDDEEKSGPSLSADERTAADNLAAQITRSGSMGGATSSVTDEQAGCIGEGAVTQVGLGALQDYGIITEDLRVDRSIQGVRMGREHADALAGVFVDCIDAEALFEQRFLDQLPPGDSPADRRACVEEAVGEDAVREVLSASFQGRKSRAYPRLERAVAACADAGGPEQ